MYEHPELQTIHEYILKNKLSTDASNDLLDLWTLVRKINKFLY